MGSVLYLMRVFVSECFSGMDSAKAITFGDIGVRSVTREGDSFDPSGTLTGGSRPKESAVLRLLTELNEKQSDLAELNAEIADLRSQVERARNSKNARSNCVEQRQMTEHRLSMLQ